MNVLKIVQKYEAPIISSVTIRVGNKLPIKSRVARKEDALIEEAGSSESLNLRIEGVQGGE